VAAEAPRRCPKCAGEIEVLRTHRQYQEDLPPIRPFVTAFDIEQGRCCDCGACVQGHHPEQISDAIGAAGVHIGPRACALIVDLKLKGMSFAKISAFLEAQFGLKVTPGALVGIIARVSTAAKATHEGMIQSIRSAPVVSPDETGWRVNGGKAWLWTFVAALTTVYAIEIGRGFKAAAAVLGEDFDGILARDGWAVYRRFAEATHQTCIAHILRRIEGILETAKAGAARLPKALKRIFKAALDLRDKRESLDPGAFQTQRDALVEELGRYLEWQPKVEVNRRLVKHLRNECMDSGASSGDKERAIDAAGLLTFLDHPEAPATNFWAENALRPAIATRKLCGCNRSWAGARNFAVLMSIYRTAQQRGLDPTALVVELLRATEPTDVLASPA